MSMSPAFMETLVSSVVFKREPPTTKLDPTPIDYNQEILKRWENLNLDHTLAMWTYHPLLTLTNVVEKKLAIYSNYK